MKKGISLLLVLALALSLGCTVYAADHFVSSVTAKPAPEIIVTGTAAETPLVEVVNGNGEELESFAVDSVVITPVAGKDENHVSEAVKASLTEIYDQLSRPETKLSEIMPGLEAVIETAAQEDASVGTVEVDRLVVKDLFCISVSGELTKALEREGSFLKLTFEPKLAQDQHLFVMVWADGQWHPVRYVRNADGTITCTFDTVGTVAFLVDVDYGQ